MAAMRTRNTYLRALYERQHSRIAHGKAIGAVKHSILGRRLAHAQHRRACFVRCAVGGRVKER